MDHVPERKPVADLIEQPQLCAVEINIDRVDLKIPSYIDIEELVLWIQIMDLPIIELSPYQNENTNLFGSTESVDKNVGANTLTARLRSRYSLRKEKVSSRLFKYHRKTTSDNGVNQDENKNDDSNLDDVARDSTELKDDVELDRKLEDVENGDLPVLDEEESTNKFNKNDKEGQCLKKIKFLKMLLDDLPIEAPEGVAFHSHCCILIPSSSLFDLLSRMQRYPIVIYVILMERSCSKLIGKSTFKFDHKFLNAAIKASKLKAARISECDEQSLPVYCTRSTSKQVRIGSLISSISLICFGRFGMTEIVTDGDLMSAKYKEWECRTDNFMGLPENVDISEQPYGFEPVVTRNELPSSSTFEPDSSPDNASLLDFVHTFFKPNLSDHAQCNTNKYKI